MDTWVVQMVRGRSSRRVTAWACVLGAVVLLGIAQHRYIGNFLMGPFELGKPDLDSIADVSATPRYFARVTGSKVLDTGIQQITIRKTAGVETSRSVSAAYRALVIGDRFLVVKHSSGAPTTVEGELRTMPLDLDSRLFNSPEMQALRSRFYPFYLDDDSFRFEGYLAIAGLLVFGFLLVRYGGPAWRHLQDPSSHPVVKRVVSWGDPVGIAAEARRESGSPRHKGGGWLVTDKYLIQSTFFTFDLLRLSDLLWAYKRVTKHSVNFIPTGKTYEAVLACYGGQAAVKAREKNVDAVLAFAAERAPWAVFGFSKELETLFNKNNRDFCAAVEQRKRDQAQQARVQPAA
jgi:hypothetical protein